MNITHITGRLGADAEVKTFDSGARVINFNVATNKRYKNKEGEWVEITNWVSCSRFVGDSGSVKVAEYLKKGTEVAASGESGARAFIDNATNEARAVVTLRVTSLELLGSRAANENQPATRPAEPVPINNQDTEDDLPF